MARLLRLLALLRTREWIHFLVLPLAGMGPAGDARPSIVHAVRGVAIAACVLAFGYLLNAASDVDVDVDSRKNPLLDTGRRRHVPQIAAGLASAAMGLALLGPPVAWAATATSLLSGVVYSVGPRLKAMPLVGTLANATNFVPLLWVGAAIPDPPAARHLAPAFTGLLLQSQLLHEAADSEGDARANVRTTFLSLGRGASAALCAAFGVMATLDPDAGWGERAAIFAAYGLAVPIAFALLATSPDRAAKLRRWHRWSGVALGGVLFAQAT